MYMFDAEEYRAANYLPDKLQSDLMMVKSWMEDLARHRTTSVHGLLHFDMAPTRAALMPQVSGSYQVLMTSLTTHMMTLLKDLQARLARYISRCVRLAGLGDASQGGLRMETLHTIGLCGCALMLDTSHRASPQGSQLASCRLCNLFRLRNRPSELPEFVAHTEATWPHLEESGFKRQRIMFMQEHLERLYQIIKGVSATAHQGQVWVSFTSSLQVASTSCHSTNSNAWLRCAVCSLGCSPRKPLCSWGCCLSFTPVLR